MTKKTVVMIGVFSENAPLGFVGLTGGGAFVEPAVLFSEALGVVDVWLSFARTMLRSVSPMKVTKIRRDILKKH